MEHTKALAILDALSGGIDPISGEAFPADSPYQHPDIVRALFHAVRLLGGDSAVTAAPAAVADAGTTDSASQPQAKPARTTPGNTGKPWSTDEDERLVAAFDAGTALPDLARLHGRSRFAIEVRLARFERLPLPQGTRFPPRARQTAEADTSTRQAGESGTSPRHAADAATLHYRADRRGTPRPHAATGVLQ